MNDLDKKIDILFTEVKIGDEDLKNKLKIEFKDHLLMVFTNTIVQNLSEQERNTLENLFKTEDINGIEVFVEAHPGLKKAVADFWENKAPVLMQDYKKQVLDN